MQINITMLLNKMTRILYNCLDFNNKYYLC